MRDEKLTALAVVIDAVAPDVLALQEVGPPEELADLNAACAIDFDDRLLGKTDRRGIRVALLSPRQLSHRRDSWQFPPGVLPVQCRDTMFDSATTTATGRSVLSATVESGGNLVPATSNWTISSMRSARGSSRQIWLPCTPVVTSSVSSASGPAASGGGFERYVGRGACRVFIVPLLGRNGRSAVRSHRRGELRVRLERGGSAWIVVIS